jgi:HlyD family secretion protein
VALLTTLVIALGAAVVLLSLRVQGESPVGRYHTETAFSGQVTGVLHVPAHVTPTATLRVGAEQPGTVAWVAVRPGDQVRAGQVLARLDDRGLRAVAAGAAASAVAAQVNAQQAKLRLAQLVYLLREAGRGPSLEGVARPEKLTGELQAAALEAEVDMVNAAAELKKQSAAASATRMTVSHAVLRSPISGVVMSRTVEPGETVPAGAPLFIIASDPRALQLVATVNEADVARVTSPAPARFTVPAYPGRVFHAVVAAVEPASDAGGRFSYRLRLDAANAGLELRPGMSARVDLPLSSAPGALLVPAAALDFAPAGAEGGSAIYLRDGEGRPRRVPVAVGVTDGRVVEVRSGALQPGTSVIVGQRR